VPGWVVPIAGPIVGALLVGLGFLLYHFAIKPDKHEAWYNRGVDLAKLGR